MKILVTGAQGQLARSLLAAAGAHCVVAIGRPDLDITDIETVHRHIGAQTPDVVINCAAYTAVDKAESDADAAHRVNVIGAANVAAGCAVAQIPLVHISTDYVFDGRKPAPYVETDLTGPMGVYGRTKLAGEDAVAAANPRHLILRTAWVYSPYGHNFVRTMLRLAETRPELGVVDDQHGSPTYAPHLAEAILAIAPQIADAPAAAAVWGIYNAAGAGETTWCGLARDVFRRAAEAGAPVAKVNAITTADYPTPARRPANSRLDCSKLQATFGVTQPPWTSGVAACAAALLTDKSIQLAQA